MGFDKATAPVGSQAPLQRVARALEHRPAVVVVPGRLAQIATTMMPGARVVVNDEPSRGMTQSLRLALGVIPAAESFGVLLADMPAMTAETIRRTESALGTDADVAYPVSAGGIAGHPVLFAARARAVIEALPDGDLLRLARDDATFRRATWICTDSSAFLDLDVPAQWEAFSDA